MWYLGKNYCFWTTNSVMLSGNTYAIIIESPNCQMFRQKFCAFEYGHTANFFLNFTFIYNKTYW